MALEEVKVVDRIEVVENGTLQVREVIRILKDGASIAEKFHRYTFPPGSDLGDMPANVKAIAAAAWANLPPQNVNEMPSPYV